MKLTSSNYDDVTKNTKGLLVVDFWAEWCGPCKMLAPVVDETAAEMPDVTFAKLNIDDEVEVALKNKVVSIPTLFFFKDGELVKKSVGYVTKEELTEMINECKA